MSSSKQKNQRRKEKQESFSIMDGDNQETVYELGLMISMAKLYAPRAYQCLVELHDALLQQKLMDGISNKTRDQYHV